MPIISSADIDYLIPLESSAYDHWMFDRGAASLTGMVLGRMLTPGATAPTFGSNYVSLATIPAGALKTPKNDAASQTLCVVYRRPSASTLRYLAGSLDGASGSSLLALGTALGGVYGNQRPFAQIGPATHPGVQGDWVFAAFSEKTVGASKEQILMVGGQPVLSSTVANKTVAARQVVLGNGYDAASGDSIIDFAEFIVFDKALTAAELQDVYLRAKTRMGSVGITV